MFARSKKAGFLGLLVVAVMAVVPTTALVAIQQEPKDGAMITFRFDDGLTSQYEYARPILSKYGFLATAYIFTDPPQGGDWEGYMNWTQIEILHNVYGWEIGSHSKSHSDLTELSDILLFEELIGSKTILERHGFAVKSFASPWGFYNNRMLAATARFYQSHISAWPEDFNTYPFNDYEISVHAVKGLTSLKTIKSWIDMAAANGKWLVLLFHEIVEENPGEYEYSKNDFEAVVNYVNRKNIPVVTISEALQLSGKNLVLNPSFEFLRGGWAVHWLRTDKNYITVDAYYRGSLPNPRQSIKFRGGPKQYKVYPEDFIEVNPNQSYYLKVYFNCQHFISGGIDVFIDEYNSEGQWLDWVWQTGIWTEYVGYKTNLYIPNKDARKILVWIETKEDSRLTCYLDNVVLAATESG